MFYALSSFGAGPSGIIRADSIDDAAIVARSRVRRYGSSWAGATRICGPMTRAAARSWDISETPPQGANIRNV